MSFSKRYGFEREKIIQINDIDIDLKNSLLNVIYLHFFNNNPYGEIDFFVPMWFMILKRDISKIDFFRDNNAKFQSLKGFVETLIFL